MTARKTKDTSRLVYWLVFAPTKVYTVEANTASGAVEEAARALRITNRPWVWRDWRVRLARPGELELRLSMDTSRGKPAIEKAVTRQKARLHLHE
jgi:hypothetical protein